jgi:hypothetical protein
MSSPHHDNKYLQLAGPANPVELLPLDISPNLEVGTLRLAPPIPLS